MGDIYTASPIRTQSPKQKKNLDSSSVHEVEALLSNTETRFTVAQPAEAYDALRTREEISQVRKEMATQTGSDIRGPAPSQPGQKFPVTANTRLPNLTKTPSRKTAVNDLASHYEAPGPVSSSLQVDLSDTTDRPPTQDRVPNGNTHVRINRPHVGSSLITDEENNVRVAEGNQANYKGSATMTPVAEIPQKHQAFTDDGLGRVGSQSRSILKAFIIKGNEYRAVPHSSKLVLQPEMGIVSSQSLEPSWWADLASLTESELRALDTILSPDWDDGNIRTLVFMKRLRKTSLKFWNTTKRALFVLISSEPANDIASPRASRDRIYDQEAFATETKLRGDIHRPTKLRSGFNSLRLSDLRPRKSRMKEECQIELSTNVAYTFLKIISNGLDEDTNWHRCKRITEPFKDKDVRQRIKELNEEGPGPMVKKYNLLPAQQEQITKLIDELNTKEQDRRYLWALSQLETKVTERLIRTEKCISVTIYVTRSLNQGSV